MGIHRRVSDACQTLIDSCRLQVAPAYLATAGEDLCFIAALKDAQLSRALSALHAEPGRVWTVESLAQAAGLSRAHFAALFQQRSAAALSKHLALPCAKCLRARGVFLAPTVLRLGNATLTLRWVPTQLSGASRHRFALPGSAMVGRAPIAYLTQWRMLKAAQMLRQTEKSVKVIARGMGYRTEQTFS